MRSKIIVGATAATTAVTVVGGTVLTVATADADRAATRMTVVERAVSDAVVDLAPEGDSAGDLLTFANPVYDRTNSRKVGRDQGSCIRTVVGKAWQCSWTTWLPRSCATSPPNNTPTGRPSPIAPTSRPHWSVPDALSSPTGFESTCPPSDPSE